MVSHLMCGGTCHQSFWKRIEGSGKMLFRSEDALHASSQRGRTKSHPESSSLASQLDTGNVNCETPCCATPERLRGKRVEWPCSKPLPMVSRSGSAMNPTNVSTDGAKILKETHLCTELSEDARMRAHTFRNLFLGAVHL